jgi:hypothetical protein
MGIDLHPCPACARHIRAEEGTCPFCGEATPDGFGNIARAKLAAPMSRAAILFMGATAVSACSSSTSGSLMALYGPAPVMDSGAKDGSNDVTAVPLYAAAPVDSGVDAGAMPAYGAAPVDSGEG